MPSFFSGQGDDGYTGLLGEGRVPKYDPRPETFGTVDEASAALGLARSLAKTEDGHRLTKELQRDLYHVMSEIAATDGNAVHFASVDHTRLEWIEANIERIGKSVSLPKDFVMGGDSSAGAAFDLARTVVRRAERLVARLAHGGALSNSVVLPYLNRLSSLCFLLSLLEMQAAGIQRPSLAKSDRE
ncbi:MAG TPA: cob(I)yrinic acid a,c-diamide adenosyltransferase [Anaerolineales bacterium]|nr:cob(I)yrinic acid a,c-diamide adenosyltransferase [Anaerolineales bacterium]